MKILVTGGSGFIGGSILSSYLALKYKLIAPSHTELDLLDTVAVNEYVEKESPDIIIHCANTNRAQNAVYENTLMFNNLAQSDCGKMLNLSSGAIYDMSRNIDNLTEDYIGFSIPKDQYGYSKYIEHLIEKTYDHITDLILFGVFGAGELPTRFIAATAKHMLSGETGIAVPRRIMDFLYIKDFICILDKFIATDALYHSYNITPSIKHTLFEIFSYTSYEINNSIALIDGEQNTYTGNNALLLSEFPDIEFTPIEKAVAEYVAVLKEEYNAERHS